MGQGMLTQGIVGNHPNIVIQQNNIAFDMTGLNQGSMAVPAGRHTTLQARNASNLPSQQLVADLL